MFDPGVIIEEVQDDEVTISSKEAEILSKLSLDEPWPWDETLLRNTLVNGLKYYIFSSKPKQLLRLRLIVKVGSINEEDDELGYAHFLEHLMFRVSNLDEDIVQFMNSIGITFGAHVNALTSFDFTYFDLVIPVDDSTFSENSDSLKHLHKALGIFAEWIFRASFSRELVDLERNVVLREMEINFADKGKMHDDALHSVLQGSSYANRTPIGTAETLSKCTSDSIQSFYEKWYQPHVMGLVVVGDVDSSAKEKIEELVKHYFETNKKPPVSKNPLRLSTTRAIADSRGHQKKTIRDSWIRNVQAEHDSPQVTIFDDPDYGRATVQLIYRFPDISLMKPALTPRMELIEVLKTVCANFMCSLVRGNSKNLRRFVDSYAATNGERLTQTMFTTGITFGSSIAHVFELLEFVLLEIKRFSTYGPLEAEFQPLKQILQMFCERDASSQDLLNDIGESFLYNASFYSKPALKLWTERLWDVLTTKDFIQAASEVYKPEFAVLNFAGSFAGSGITPEEAEAKVLAIFEKVKNTPVSPAPPVEPWSLYDGFPAEKFLSLDVNSLVKSQHVEQEHGIIEFELKNGAKIQVKMSDPESDYRADSTDLGIRCEVSAPGFGLAAVQAIAPSKYWTARYLSYFFNELLEIPWYHWGRTVMEYGFKTTVNDVVMLWYRGLSLTSTSELLEPALVWIYQLFAKASSDKPFGGKHLEEILEVLKEVAELEKPTSLMEKLSVKIKEVEYNNCPLLQQYSQDIQVDFKFMKEYFQLLFSDPSEFTFSFAGMFGPDPMQTIQMIVAYIGSIPKPKKRSPLFNKFHTSITEEAISTQLYEKYYAFPTNSIDHYIIKSGGGNTAYMTMLWPITLMDDMGWLFMSLCNTIVQQRLNRLLRFQLGEVYTLDVQMSFPYGMTIPGQNGIYLYCQIDHVEKVVDLIIKTLQDFQKEGPTPREIESACLQAQRQQQEAVQNTSVWAANLSSFKSRENAGAETGDISPFMAQFGMINQKDTFIQLLTKESAGVLKQAFPVTSYQLFIGVPENVDEQTVFPHTPAHVITEKKQPVGINTWIKAGAAVAAVSVVAAVAWRYYSRK